MTVPGKYNEIFNASGCINTVALLAYRDGTLDAELLQAAESHLATCLLCSEALEGLEFAGPAEEVEKSLATLSDRFEKRKRRRNVPVLLHPASFTGKILYGSVAASITLLMVFFFTLLSQEDALSQAFAEGSTIVPTDVIPRIPVVKAFPTDPDDIKKSIEEAPVSYIAEAKEAVTEDKLAETSFIAVVDDYDAGMMKDADFSPSYTATANMNTINNFNSDSLIIAYDIDGSEDIMDKEAVESKMLMDEVEVVGVPARDMSADVISKNDVYLNGVTVAGQKGKRTRSPATTLSSDILTIAEKMPEFPGGNDSLTAYIKRNLEYPDTTMQFDAGTIIYVSFIINEKGKVKDARISRGYNKEMDKAVLKLVKNMPDWIPGEQGGEKVKVRQILAVMLGN